MSEKILAVDRALDILIYLHEVGEEVGISEISRDLDLPKSTVHRTLSTLKAKGFVHKNELTEKYWLGMRLFSIGSAVGRKIPLVDIVEPYVEELHEEMQEVINVSILHDIGQGPYKTIMVHKKSGDANVLSVNPQLGSVIDAHTSSVGKSILAFKEDVNYSRLEEDTLKRYTENTITNSDEMKKEFEKIRINGYATNDEEQEIGLYCIGAPILNGSGNAIAAVSISGPTARMKDENLDERIKKLLETTANINKTTRYM